MYFEIVNTPEHTRKARKTEKASEEFPREECPRLVLAPFSRPPQVVFDSVLIGSSYERNLEVYNPSKQAQQITLGKALPPGLVIELPEGCLELEPETCYCVTLVWTPSQPTAIRDTIHFTTKNRGRYDIILVLKSVLYMKEKKNQPKGFKTSPGKIKKKASKKSPVAIYKKKSEIIFNTTAKIKKTFNVVESTQLKVFRSSNKENICANNDYSIGTYTEICPFDDASFSNNINFNTSEIFSQLRKSNLRETYDKPFNVTNTLEAPQNILKPCNKTNISATDIFDNLTFTPLKSAPSSSDKLDQGPRILVSVDSNSDFDDSLNSKNDNKENETHSILSITTTQPANKWLTVNHQQVRKLDTKFVETPVLLNKKQPNTSSPKEFNSPNFTINTELSRISDMSFFPTRFSTERKCYLKVNESQEMIDDKLSSDTFTKESPNMPMDHKFTNLNCERPPHYFMREQTKMCRQSLFRENHHPMQQQNYDKKKLGYELNVWQPEMRGDGRSPPRSITPPLHSIPEESMQYSQTQILDKTDQQQNTFTINRTFDKPDRPLLSTSCRQTWAKKAVRCETDLWKIPVLPTKKVAKTKTSIKSRDSINKISNTTFETNRSINRFDNVYSQSLTVDPFLSTTYFYDEEAVVKFENEFKRWLNCVLTPPADLDSNVEQKIDVGKAWIENKNKEVPLAPTKEQVSNNYHNSHRLASLRKSARALLMSPELTQVFQKLNAQIDKKLIAIRTDRNLHLDVGLQKMIMEVILSYNPLWLRIGLEAIYGLVLPLKSNNDIEGLTTFIIQRMFKNPHLKNKQSKSNAPNMLLPAYMEAIKKFTLKKFFMLVFFLDQAKQRKLIQHDPCLFCRNAICKESREIVIRFTRDLIAGIGDITKHLRPLGYIVCHKQSYLDEYKYAVHNIALDIKDGVRLTKVMEIIMMKNSLLNQLRTPAISRLQKIHNVQVALNALKDAKFTIVGDITAADIADGHREKTLSLLWQLIHVFRAPLFEKAANVIQTWWRKKYEVIVEKRREEEKARMKLTNAANIIQHWWRLIQYDRQVEWQMQRVTTATIIVQKYCRMWLCRTRLQKLKKSVLKVEKWFLSTKMIREARQTLKKLWLERQKLLIKSAVVIQSNVRRWLCVRSFNTTVRKIIHLQSAIRRFVERSRYIRLKESVIFIQQKYRRKLLMRAEMQKLAKQKRSVILVQSYCRMIIQRRNFLKINKFVRILEERYIAVQKMREEQSKYLKQRKNIITIQAWYRSRKCQKQFIRQINLIVTVQRKFRAYQLMNTQRAKYLQIRNAVITLQKYAKSYLIMKKIREIYIKQRESAVLIQRYFRSHLLAKLQRKNYLQIRNATITVQTQYRSLLSMRRDRLFFKKLKKAALCFQRQYRSQAEMRKCRQSYNKLRNATLCIQRRYRALIDMRKERRKYLQLRSSCTKIQNAYRAYAVAKRERATDLKRKEAAICIQKWFRNCKKGREVKEQFYQTKQACKTIQTYYKALLIGRKQRQEYIRIRTSAICIQKFYRSLIVTRTVKRQFTQLKTSTIKIQRIFRSLVEMKKQRKVYMEMKWAVSCTETYYRRYKEYITTRKQYLELRHHTICMQRRYRSVIAMRAQKNKYLKLKQAAVRIQQRYKALKAMREQRNLYETLRAATITLQTRYRAHKLMIETRTTYTNTVTACIRIQRFYRAVITGTKQKHDYLKLKNSAVNLQRRYRALLSMRKERKLYVIKQKAVVFIQRRYRAQKLIQKMKHQYIKTLSACKVIQCRYRAYLIGKQQREEYIKIKTAASLIQSHYRMLKETKKVRCQYLIIRSVVINIQRRFRAKRLARSITQNGAATTIQRWYRSVQKRNSCRRKYLGIRKAIITIQSVIRMFIHSNRFLEMKSASITIQRHYRSYKQGQNDRETYLQMRRSIILIQSQVRCLIQRRRYLKIRATALTLQAVYRLKRQRVLTHALRTSAAICLQKNIRRYIIQSWYRRYREKVVLIQRVWKGNLLTRLIRCEFLQKKRFIIRLQSAVRGYLTRKQVQSTKEQILKLKEEKRQYWAASKIQALFRGHKARMLGAYEKRVADLRRRWREGALESTQASLKDRSEEAIEVLRLMPGIEMVIDAFKNLEFLTEVYPMMYDHNASAIVRRVYVYMSVTNRSVSSIELLKSTSAILVNLARYKVTGPKIYDRERINPILKFMWRFSLTDIQLFCILATYIWLFAKYDSTRDNLKEFLHTPENHKMLVTIKGNIGKLKRMAENTSRNKFATPRPSKFVSHTNSDNLSMCSNSSDNGIVCPAVDPDYGILRKDKPRYFEDPQQAITCLFTTYQL